MVRFIPLVFFILLSLATHAQQFSFSFGVYTGVTGSFTSDEGIKKDPRYEGSFEAKFAPVGINVGLDYEGVGLMVSPGLINIGQNFYVVNTSGGQDGRRKIDLQYLTVPVSFKVHLVQFNAFKLSALASISPAFLLKGTEYVSHRSTKLEFPPETYSILPSSYTIEYDGVLAPEVDRYSLGEKKDFRSLQLYVGAGFRTDWDPSDHWRISADLRVNYGIFDPRTDQYTKNRESTLSLYEIPGERRDMFVQFTVGISRYIEFEKSDYDRKKKLKGSSKKYRPTQYPGSRMRQSKPKD